MDFPSKETIVIVGFGWVGQANALALTHVGYEVFYFDVGKPTLKYADKYHYDFVVQIDGDGQHDPKYLLNILEPVMQGKLDMCIGSRFLPPFLGYQSSFVRRIGINFFAGLISFLTGLKTTDPTSGFRAFNRKVIEVFAEYYPQDYPEPEAIVVAKRYGARIEEVPVQMRKRASGSSSIRYIRTLYYMVKVTLAILVNQIKQKKELSRDS